MSISKYYAYESIYWIATPDELEALLSREKIHLLTVNSHVPIDYTESPLSEALEPYRDLYRLISAGERLNRDQHWPLFRSYNATKDTTRCVFGNEHTYQGRLYKTADRGYHERCVNMEPFVLYKEVKKDGCISIVKCAFHLQFPENTVGIKFYCATKRYTWDVPEPVTSLKDSPEYQDFQFIKSCVQALTKPLKIQVGEKTVNTGIRISEAAKQDARSFYFFTHNGFTLL